ncbi:MAG: hypothetical protein ABL962_11655 [Fimbriimonadaceae bacterium]
MERKEALIILREWLQWQSAHTGYEPSDKYRPLPDFFRWELYDAGIVGHGERSVIDGRQRDAGGQTLKYHNEPYTRTIPFADLVKIEREGRLVKLFGAKDKSAGPFNFALALLVVPPGERPASEYCSALLALCPNVK